MNCKSCGKKVASTANRCSCGRDPKNPKDQPNKK